MGIAGCRAAHLAVRQDQSAVQPAWPRQAAQPAAHSSGPGNGRRRHASIADAHGADGSPRFLLRLPSPAADDEQYRHVAECGGAARDPPAGLTGNGGSRSSGQKAFDHYAHRGGHKSLPLAEQPHRQRNGQSLHGLCPAGRAAATVQSAIATGGERRGKRTDQPAPTYPRVFLNTGSYYPNYSPGQ